MFYSLDTFLKLQKDIGEESEYQQLNNKLVFDVINEVLSEIQPFHGDEGQYHSHYTLI